MKNDYPKLRAFLRSLPNPEAQEEFARKCGTSLSYLRKAMSKGSRMDVALVERIVEQSGFIVPAEELRTDVNWMVFAMEHAAKAPAEARRAGARGRQIRGGARRHESIAAAAP